MLRAVNMSDFVAMQFPPRELILHPWLPTSGLCMVHAFRGIGKTHLALAIAYAVATGGTFLGWQSTKKRGVLYIDGEMPASVLQERLLGIVAMNGGDTIPDNIKIITPDLQNGCMPDLSTEDGQALINERITDEIDLIIIDNLSCLARSIRENESDDWNRMQSWVLSLRAKRKSVLLIHHSGKGGTQRGASKKEDVLDTVIMLERPKDYDSSEGARFIVRFEKARGFFGEDAQPFEARLIDESGRQAWVAQSLDDSTYIKVVSLSNEGMSQAEIAIELNIHKSGVSRYARRGKEEGLIAKQKIESCTVALPIKPQLCN
ncbi:MAG: AAA family ATPase [Gammaproteobacteria bacterium]